MHSTPRATVSCLHLLCCIELVYMLLATILLCLTHNIQILWLRMHRAAATHRPLQQEPSLRARWLAKSLISLWLVIFFCSLLQLCSLRRGATAQLLICAVEIAFYFALIVASKFVLLPDMTGNVIDVSLIDMNDCTGVGILHLISKGQQEVTYSVLNHSLLQQSENNVKIVRLFLIMILTMQNHQSFIPMPVRNCHRSSWSADQQSWKSTSRR